MIALKALFLCLLVSKACCLTVKFKFTLRGVVYYGDANSDAVSDGSQWLTLTSVNRVKQGDEILDQKMTTKDLAEVYKGLKGSKALREPAISTSRVPDVDVIIDDGTWKRIFIIQVETNQSLCKFLVCYISFAMGNYRYSDVTAESILGGSNTPLLNILKIGTVVYQSPNSSLSRQDMDVTISTFVKRMGDFKDFKLSVDGTDEELFISVIGAEVGYGTPTTVNFSYKIRSFWKYSFVLGGKTYYGVAEEVTAPQTLQIVDAFTGNNKLTQVTTKNLFEMCRTYQKYTNAKVAKISTPYDQCFDANQKSVLPVTIVSFTLTGVTLEFSYNYM